MNPNCELMLFWFSYRPGLDPMTRLHVVARGGAGAKSPGCSSPFVGVWDTAQGMAAGHSGLVFRGKAARCLT